MKKIRVSLLPAVQVQLDVLELFSVTTDWLLRLVH